MFKINKNNFQNKTKSIPNSLILYYSLFNDLGVLRLTQTNFLTNPLDSETYRGYGNIYATDSTFLQSTTDILTYVSSRTKANPPDFSKAMFNEVLTIISYPYNENMVQAVANYVDPGTDIETQVKFTNFTITGASGKFVGYKNIKINYDNLNPKKTRILIFS